MADKYTYADIIIDPNDPRLDGALDEKCYAGETPAMTLNFANKGIEEGLFIDMNAESFRPFKISYGKIIDHYPAIIIKKDQPQKSYEERQAEWIKENDIKIGDRVKVVRGAVSYDDGWESVWVDIMDQTVGAIGIVGCIFGSGNRINGLNGIEVRIDKWTCIYPYFVLEKVTKKYVPFDLSDPEVRKSLRGRWIISKYEESPVENLIHQFAYFNSTHDWRLNGCSASYWFDNYTFDDGTPFGQEVEE